MEYHAIFELGLGLVTALLMAFFVARHFLERRRARRSKPIVAKVVAVTRRELDTNRAYDCGVDTIYDVPGHGELVHSRLFGTEGQAILFSRLHKEGTSHRVVPNSLEPGKVFLWEELSQADTSLVTQLIVGLAMIALAVYAVVEYYGD